jgi:hypothetical protein
MNYYERHIGDYARDTAHLSMLEHGAYSLLLDRYYMTERAIPTDEAHRLARARTALERAAVSAVLHGRLGGRPKSNPTTTDEEPAGFSVGSGLAPQEKAHQTPNTKHQELNPPTPGKRGSTVHDFPPGFEVLWVAFPRKTAKPKAAKAFARLKPDDAMLATMLAALAVQKRSEQWTKDGGQFIPHPATWLNERRWEDEAPSLVAKNDPFAGAA